MPETLLAPKKTLRAKPSMNIESLRKPWFALATILIFVQGSTFGLSVATQVININTMNDTLPDSERVSYVPSLAVSGIGLIVIMAMLLLVGCACVPLSDRLSTTPVGRSTQAAQLRNSRRRVCGIKCGVLGVLFSYLIASICICVSYSVTRYEVTKEPTRLYFTNVDIQMGYDLLFLVVVALLTLIGRLLMGEVPLDAMDLSIAVVSDGLDVIELSQVMYDGDPIDISVAVKVFVFIFLFVFALYPVWEQILTAKRYRNSAFVLRINSSMLFALTKIFLIHIPFIVMRSLLVSSFKENSINSAFILKNVWEVILLSVQFQMDFRDMRSSAIHIRSTRRLKAKQNDERKKERQSKAIQMEDLASDEESSTVVGQSHASVLHKSPPSFRPKHTVDTNETDSLSDLESVQKNFESAIKNQPSVVFQQEQLERQQSLV